jgi:hypothetical protein
VKGNQLPSFNLSTKSLRYCASDETALDKATALIKAMSEYDPAAKQDATSALTYLGHLSKHVAAQRKPEPKTP